MISPARELAFQVLLGVETGGYASDLLRQRGAKLDSRDAGLAEVIVLGSLRIRAHLDFLIDHFAGRPQPKLDPEVRAALRMGIYQIRYLDRIPPHAAVMESVELVKHSGKRSATGFVNAVLRKVHRQPVPFPDRATELSLPAWLLDKWAKHYGTNRAYAAARAALDEPETAVNLETGRQQDIGAQSIVPLLDLKPGMRVLDLCAAPGNKTAQILAAGAQVVAGDRYIRRLNDVPAEAERLVLDATQPLPFTTLFERILIDAPCSGTGTLSRNPEIKWRLAERDLERFVQTQRAMLQHAVPLLAPGGLLVYSTCSLEPEENEAAVAGLPVISTQLRLPGRDPGDGFFAAVISLPQ